MWIAILIYFIDVIALADEASRSSVMWGSAIAVALYLVAFFLWTDGFDTSEKAKASDKNGYRIFRGTRKMVFTLATLAFITGMLMPTKETSYKMLAAYGVYEVATSETAQKYAGGSLKVLDKAMTEYLGEGWDKAEGVLEKVKEKISE